MRWWKKRRGKSNGASDGDGCLELKTKTVPIPVFHDAGGKFICYCNYEGHPGCSVTPDLCEERRCVHYYKMPINGPGYFPQREKSQSSRMPSTGRPYSGNGHH